jgi:hypothetical protein
MTTHAEKIIDLLKQKSSLRPVQIADLLDIDIDIVENTLVVLAKDGKVVGQPGIAPNKLPMTTYSLPAGALNWNAPTSVQPAHTPVGTQVATSTDEPLSRVQKAMAFLRSKQEKVFVKDLCEAMGIEHPKYSPTQYLANQIRLGEVVRDGKWYAIANAGQLAEPVKQKTELTIKPTEKAKEEVAPIAMTQTPPTPPITLALNHGDAFNVSDFLQTSLSADEWRGYMKANVIDLTLRGDFAGAYECAGRLAAAQI